MWGQMRRSLLWANGGETVLFVAQSPGFDGAEGKAVALAFLIFEGQFAYRTHSLGNSLALGHVDSGEDPHFYVFGWISHKNPTVRTFFTFVRLFLTTS